MKLSKNIIEAKFERASALLLQTKPWRQMTADERQYFEKMPLYEDESPILGFFKNDNYLWMLTTDRLLIFDSGSFKSFKFSEISEIEIIGLEDGTIAKQNISAIRIMSTESNINLELEQGSWHVIYPILQFIQHKFS